MYRIITKVNELKTKLSQEDIVYTGFMRAIGEPTQWPRLQTYTKEILIPK